MGNSTVERSAKAFIRETKQDLAPGVPEIVFVETGGTDDRRLAKLAKKLIAKGGQAERTEQGAQAQYRLTAPFGKKTKRFLKELARDLESGRTESVVATVRDEIDRAMPHFAERLIGVGVAVGHSVEGNRSVWSFTKP